MILSGHLLIYIDGVPYEPNETTIGFSQNKNELDSEADERNKKLEAVLHRFQNLCPDIENYENKFDEFRISCDYQPSRKDFQRWLEINPIPENLTEFVEFSEPEESSSYSVYFNSTQEYELEGSYYVQSFGPRKVENLSVE